MTHKQKQMDSALLKQFSLRQEDTDQQVLQALQQAMNALLQAQQLLQKDRKYHQTLQQVSGKYESQHEYSAVSQNENGSVPPWILGHPPDLQ